MNDLTARWDDNSIHVFRQAIHIFDAYLVFFRTAGDTAMVYGTANVLSRNTYIHHTNIYSRHIAGFFNSLLNGKNSFINVGYNSFYYAFWLSFAHSQYFELAELILATYNRNNFCCADVEPYYYFFVFHDVLYV